MFYHFLIPLIENFHFLNLFNYLTFRAGGALFTAFFISFLLGPKLIKILKKIQKEGQPIRKDGPKSHLISKVGTPTMGGMLILISLFFSIILWGDLSSYLFWLVFSITILFSCLKTHQNSILNIVICFHVLFFPWAATTASQRDR